MLEISNATKIDSNILAQLPCSVELPEEWRDYFEHNGMIPADFNDRRQFPRFYIRGKAILKIGDEIACVYTKDVSRNSIAFIHHEQLFPKQRPTLLLPNGMQRTAVIIRCQRIQRKCFECAARFCDDETE